MKHKTYILSLFTAVLLLVGVADVGIQAQTKMQSTAVSAAARTMEFTAYVNGQDLHIDFNEAVNTGYTVELYNITGAKVADWKVDKNTDKYCELSINQYLRKGLYIVKISAGQQVLAKKLQI